MRYDYLPLGSFARVKGGKRLPPNSQLTQIPTQHPYIRVRDLGNCKTLELNADCQYIDDKTQSMISRYTVRENDIIISIVGTIGLIAKIGQTLDGANLTENCAKIIELKNLDADFLYYYLTSVLGQNEIAAATVGAVQAKLPLKNILTLQIPNLPFPEQKSIAAVLSALDAKIEINNRINKNLEAQAQAIFKSWFVDFEPFRDGEFVESELGLIPKGWRVDKASNVFNISIGKTPPRKEPEWFTKKSKDMKWLSIADMGRAGVYAISTSEFLTSSAIDKFNIKVVEPNTVLLSFKLTIGRVVITSEKMTTNEAIAHFSCGDPVLLPFTYFYLKQFNYEKLGNTSSIANAVNSKTIKSMFFLMPPQEILQKYYNFTDVFLKQIRALEYQNQTLADLRDTLLPKLMSGEIRVPLEV